MATELNQRRIDQIDSMERYEIPDAPSISVEPGQDVGDLIDTAPAGTTLILEDGDHEIGRISRSAGVTVMARNKQQAVIKATAGDTISMMDGSQLSETLFRGLFIEASSRSALMTLSENPPYRMNFLDCVIDGGYDHSKRQGRDTKWGLMPHRWAGYAARCTFQNIYREHGIYCHTPASDILLYKNLSQNTGRTSYQFVGRNGEAGYADVELHVKGCTLKNPGLKDGGSSLTAYGIGTLLVEDSEFIIGGARVDPDLNSPANAQYRNDRIFRDEYMLTHPTKKTFSTGHIVNWKDWKDGVPRADPTKLVTLKNVNIYSHPGDGNAKCVEITNANGLAIEGRAYIQPGFNPTAMELSLGMPVDYSKMGDHKVGGPIKLV